MPQSPPHLAFPITFPEEQITGKTVIWQKTTADAPEPSQQAPESVAASPPPSLPPSTLPNSVLDPFLDVSPVLDDPNVPLFLDPDPALGVCSGRDREIDIKRITASAGRISAALTHALFDLIYLSPNPAPDPQVPRPIWPYDQGTV